MEFLFYEKLNCELQIVKRKSLVLSLSLIYVNQAKIVNIFINCQEGFVQLNSISGQLLFGDF